MHTRRGDHQRPPCAMLCVGVTLKQTDAEVITLEICGEYFQPQTDKAIFRYFHTHYPHFFPNLTYRTLFVKQVTNLRQSSELIQQRLVEGGGQRTANWACDRYLTSPNLPHNSCQTPSFLRLF